MVTTAPTAPTAPTALTAPTESTGPTDTHRHDRCGGACLSRRVALGVGGVAGLSAVVALAGCSGGGRTGEQPSAAAGEVLAALDDVPVGGAISATTADGSKVLITQPAAGEVHVFSAVCTHAGCTVEPGEGELDCPCHGSVFDPATGEPTHGPAAEPLPSIEVTVADGEITVA